MSIKKVKTRNARHTALIELLKTFVDAKEYLNAEAVSDYLKKEELNKENEKDLYITRAYLYQKREDYNRMVQNLTQAVPLLSSKEDRARIYYIIGQVFQELGFDSQAYDSYRNCLRSNPNFDLSFYAKLNIAQVTALSNSDDLKQVRKYFKKLLKDRKNEEFKDKIYYEIGNFELKQKNIEEAIENYNSSLRASNNQRQKGYSYLRLGEIYYGELKNYELAKIYYDSVVNAMPKTEELYQEVAERQKILANFVTQLNIIREQDSLLALSNMDTTALGKFVDEYIVKQQELEKEAEKEKKRKEARSRVATSFQNGVSQINTNLTGATWYFYNTSVQSQGRNEFVRKWGGRRLEDNWRRSSKDQTISDPSLAATNEVETEDTNQISDDPGASNFDRGQLMAAVPRSEEEIQSALSKIEEAHYKLGNIYDFDLEEKDNAINTFETMLSRFPETEYRPEVMYQLYLLYKDKNDDKYVFYKDALIRDFPKSDYARIIINPNFRLEDQATTAKLEGIYKEAYEHYERNEYGTALSLLKDALRDHPENDFSDNLKLLEIIILGHTEDIYKYQYELNNFISTYSESELLPFAEKLVKTSEEYQINLFNSSRAKFIKYFDQSHFFVLVYPADRTLAEELPATVQRFYKSTFPKSKLTTANLILDADRSIVMVNEFAGKPEAMEFFDSFVNSDALAELPSEKMSSFVITEDNFKIFYETKELNSYKKFFKDNYLNE